MTRTYQRSFTPQRLTEDDRDHGVLALNLIGGWNRWIKRRVEQVELLDDTSVRRQCSVDFRMRRWFPEPHIEWDGEGVHYVPIAILTKGSLVDFDVRDECGASVPVLTRRKNSSIAAAAISALVQMSVWVEVLKGHGRTRPPDDGSLPPDPRQILLPRAIEDEFVRITYLPAANAHDHLAALLHVDSEHAAPVEGWVWIEHTRDQGRPSYWTADVSEETWWNVIAADIRIETLLSDFAESWMVSVPVKHEPGRRRVLKFSYHEHRLEPPVGMMHRMKSIADRSGFGALLDKWEDSLEGLPTKQEYEWEREHSGHRQVAPLTTMTWLRRAAAWEGHTVEFHTPAVGKGGSYHLELMAPAGTQIRRAASSPREAKTSSTATNCVVRAGYSALISTSAACRPAPKARPR